MLRESWAEGVETIVINDRYKRLNPNYKSSQPGDNGGRWNAGRQRQTAFQMDEYTPIVEDLIDNLNQGITPPNSGFPADRVIGYNLNQIQNALNKCRDINCWESKLRSNFNNPTENNLSELFNYLRTVRNNASNW